MKKNIFGRKFKRDVNQRTALFKGLMSELVMHGRIETTEQKAKAIRASSEKLIKKAQKQGLLAKKLLSTDLIPAAMDRVIKEIAPQFVGRNGGYTRIIHTRRRFNDDASMVLLEWVDGVGQNVKTQKTVTKKAERKSSGTKSDILEGEIVTAKSKKETAKKEEKKKENLPKKPELAKKSSAEKTRKGKTK